MFYEYARRQCEDMDDLQEKLKELTGEEYDDFEEFYEFHQYSLINKPMSIQSPCKDCQILPKELTMHTSMWTQTSRNAFLLINEKKSWKL